MNEPRHAIHEIRCSVCGDPCEEGECGTLQGSFPSAASGRSERFQVHLCQGCFLRTLSYLRQERRTMHLFCEQPPASDESFGLVIDPWLVS